MLVLVGVAYRLCFAGLSVGFFNNGLADIVFFAGLLACLAAMVAPGAPPLRLNLPAAALCLFILALFITARTSLYPRNAVTELANLAALGCLFVLVSGTFFSQADAPRAAAFLVSIAAVPLVVGLYQNFFEFPRLLQDLKTVTLPGWIAGIYVDAKSAADFRTRVENSEIFSTFLFSNVFAGYLALILPVTLGLGAAVLKGGAPRSAKILAAVLAAALVALESACLVLTKSKAGLAAAAVALFIFAVLVLYKLLSRRAFVIVLVAGLVVSAAGTFVGLSRARQSYYEAMTSLEVRQGYWRATLRLIKADPLAGVGPGNFAENYVAFKRPGEREVKNPHNAYLLAWAEGGLFSLLFFVAFWVLVFAGPREKAPAAHSPPGALSFALAPLAAAALFVLVQGDLFGPDASATAAVVSGALLASILAPLLWRLSADADLAIVNAGLAAGVAGFALHSAADIDFSEPAAAAAVLFAAAALSPRGKFAALSSGSRRAVFAAGLAAVALLLFMVKVYLPCSQAETFIDAAGSAAASGDLALAADRARGAAALDPANASAPLLLARIYETQAGARKTHDQPFVLAESFYAKTLSLDPHCWPAHEGLARLYTAAGPAYLEKALKEYSALLTLHPSSSKFHWDAARLLEKAALPDSALAHYLKALDIDSREKEHGLQFSPAERSEIEAAVKRIRAAASARSAPAANAP